jgi:hypothetical protein
MIVSVDRSDENLIFVSISDFAEHLILSYVIPIPRCVKMEDCDRRGPDDFTEPISQNFGCGWLPAHFIKFPEFLLIPFSFTVRNFAQGPLLRNTLSHRPCRLVVRPPRFKRRRYPDFSSPVLRALQVLRIYREPRQTIQADDIFRQFPKMNPSSGISHQHPKTCSCSLSIQIALGLGCEVSRIEYFAQLPSDS